MITLNTVTEVLAALANGTHLVIGSKFAFIQNNETEKAIARLTLELANEVIASGKVESHFDDGIYYLVNEVVEPTQETITQYTPQDYIIEWSKENDIRKAFVEMMRDANARQEIGHDFETDKTDYYEDLHDDDILDRENFNSEIAEYHEVFLGNVGKYLEKECKYTAKRFHNLSKDVSQIDIYAKEYCFLSVIYFVDSETGADIYKVITPHADYEFIDIEYTEIDDFITTLYRATVTVKHK